MEPDAHRQATVVMPGRRRLIFWVVSLALLVTGLLALIRLVSPMPPRSLVMSTGVADGAYHRFGQRYREILKANAVTVELRPSSGAIENLARLNDGSVS